jgi:predicted nucleic acid-binding protein
VRIILDTNVVISGIFFAGPPYQILKAWREGKLHLLISEEILAEYRRVGKTLALQFPSIDLLPILDMRPLNNYRNIQVVIPYLIRNPVNSICSGFPPARE